MRFATLIKRILRVRKKSLIRCAKTNFKNFSVLRRSEEAKFPNPEEMAFSRSQDKFDGICRVLAH